MNILKKITENSKKKFHEIKKKIDITKNYTIEFKIVNEEPKIIFKENKDEKIIGDFHFFGIFNEATKIWKWSNIISNVSFRVIEYVEKLRLRGEILLAKNLEVKKSNEINMFFYQFVTNDTMYIPDEKYLGLIMDFLIFLSDDLYIFQPINSSGNIQFIGLSKINEIK
jgi:hypothetical protein